MNQLRSILVAIAACLTIPSIAVGEGRTAARLFWQDDSEATVRYGDLKRSKSGWSLEAQPVEGFPRLDTGEQSLVQMQTDGGIVMVGVHDRADGTFGSGWVAIESGATEQSHGDHSHWHMTESPRVIRSVIDDQQGNPAHVYLYGNSFVLANDKLNGFSIASAASVRDAKDDADAISFHEGGNGHITLAVAENRVAYSTWIAPMGDDMGRVDVIGLGENAGKQYSIKCPSGVLHGATYNSGKAFFAPGDGICWVNADLELDDAPESVQVNHLSLGEDADGKPLRTGAFANLDSVVLFAAGKGDESKLCWIDASSDAPEIRSLAIEVADGESLSTPVALKARGGKPMAMMFRENPTDPDTDSLVFVDLDPNKDGSLVDAKVAGTVAIGCNQIEGHSGHHAMVALPYGREVVVSNPGDGTLSIISLADFSIVETIGVEGAPTRLVAIGG